MSVAVPLREDFDADDLRRLARTSRDAGQSRRLLALAVIYEGGCGPDRGREPADGARLGVGLQRGRTCRTDRPQSSRQSTQAKCSAAAGAGAGDRGRPRPGSARRGALAAEGLGGLDLHE